MLAVSMSHHERLGTLSSFRQVGSDMIRTIGQIIPIVPLPPLEFVDDDEHYLQTEQTGIYGVRFNPQDVRQVDMTLLLHITVSLPGHPIETIFSGNVIPRMSDGYLGIKTPRSKQGYYHKNFIEHRHDQSVFSLLCKLNNIFSLSVYENFEWSLDNKGRNWDHLFESPIQARRDLKYLSFYAFKKKIKKLFQIK